MQKRFHLKRGVPHRREKRLGNGVKNLSGSVDIPKFLIVIVTEKEKPTLRDAQHLHRRIFVV